MIAAYATLWAAAHLPMPAMWRLRALERALRMHPDMRRALDAAVAVRRAAR